MFKKKDQDVLLNNNNAGANSGDNTTTDATKSKLNNLLQMEKSVIVEASEHEENNTTQLKLGRLLLSENRSENHHQINSHADAGESALAKKLQNAPERPNKYQKSESIFGSTLLSKEHQARFEQLQNPQQVMQQ